MQKSETEKAEPSAPIRQGDILKVECPSSETSPKLGVVINADCDLAHGKTDGVIAYLPIYSFEEYLELFWIPSFMKEVVHINSSKIIKIFGCNNADVSEVPEWLKFSEPDEVEAKIAAAYSSVKINRDELRNCLRRIHACVRNEFSPLVGFSLLCKEEDDPQKFALKKIKEAKKNMGDGHFFVSEIYGLEKIGFVVRMRRIYALSAERCFTSHASQHALSAVDVVTAARISRFTKLYQFKIAQLFALQFSRIGLPDEITDLGEIAMDDIAARITRGVK